MPVVNMNAAPAANLECPLPTVEAFSGVTGITSQQIETARSSSDPAVQRSARCVVRAAMLEGKMCTAPEVVCWALTMLPDGPVEPPLGHGVLEAES